MIRRSLLAWTALLAASTASVASAEMAVPQITFQCSWTHKTHRLNFQTLLFFLKSQLRHLVHSFDF